MICTKLSTPQPRDLRRDELKALRIAKQLTQVVVAEHLGCAPARISDIETGKRPLTELASAYEKFLKSAWHTIGASQPEKFRYLNPIHRLRNTGETCQTWTCPLFWGARCCISALNYRSRVRIALYT
uniref:helix-turn-helix domain-containing protein n=1 Tax=Corynebacterium flavescens TaxID=28028 RepID=UPI0035E44B48